MGLFWDKLKNMFKKPVPVMVSEEERLKKAIEDFDNRPGRFERIHYNHAVTIRKQHSQQKNWKKWRYKK